MSWDREKGCADHLQGWGCHGDSAFVSLASPVTPDVFPPQSKPPSESLPSAPDRWHVALERGPGVTLPAVPLEERHPKSVFLQSGFGLFPELGDPASPRQTRWEQACVLHGDLGDTAQQQWVMPGRTKQDNQGLFRRGLDAGGPRGGGSSWELLDDGRAFVPVFHGPRSPYNPA